MPEKSTSAKKRRTQLIAQLRNFIPETSALASLDTAKAFDSIEWEFISNNTEAIWIWS